MSTDLTKEQLGKQLRDAFQTYRPDRLREDVPPLAERQKTYDATLARMQQENPEKYQSFVDTHKENNIVLQANIAKNMEAWAQDPMSRAALKGAAGRSSVPIGFGEYQVTPGAPAFTSLEDRKQFYSGGLSNPNGLGNQFPPVIRHENQHNRWTNRGAEKDIQPMDALYAALNDTKVLGRTASSMDYKTLGSYVRNAEHYVDREFFPGAVNNPPNNKEFLSKEDVQGMTARQQIDMMNEPYKYTNTGDGFKYDHPDVGWFDESVNAAKRYFNDDK